MPKCTPSRNWITDAEQGFRLVETGLPLDAGTSSFPSTSSHFTQKLPEMTYCLVWSRGKQAQIIRLHCTCRAIRASLWNGKSTSGGGKACRSALYGEGQAWGGNSHYREYVETRWILGEHDATRDQHWQASYWNCWVFYIGCHLAWGVCCLEANNIQVRSLDTYTKDRHAARDNVGRYTLDTLQAMLRKPVCNT